MCGPRYSEKPKQELVRLDAFEILSSPLSRPVDYARTAALELVAEVLEEPAGGCGGRCGVPAGAGGAGGDAGGAGVDAGDLLLPVDEPADGVDAGAGALCGLRAGLAGADGLVLGGPAMG